MNASTFSRVGAAATLLVVAACSKSSPDAQAAARPADSASHRAGPDTGTATKPFSLTPEQLARIHVIAVAPSTFRPPIDASGVVAFDGDKTTSVISPVSGPIVTIVVDQGAVVHRGDPLAIVTSPDFASAIAAYRKADDTYKNLKRIADQDELMFKADAIARRDWEQAQTDASGAASDRDAAIEQMRSLGMDQQSIASALQNRSGPSAQAVIRAPIDGTVVERLVGPGQLLQAGSTACFTITDLSKVWVMASVFEADIGMIATGSTATIATAALPHPVTGSVAYIAAMVDSSTRATSVRVVADNPGDVLKRDMYVNVTITGGRGVTGIVIPARAVLRDDDNLPFVFVQQPDKSFLRRRIELGYRLGDQLQVTSGLTSGDHIVIDGALFIQFAESQ